MVNSSALHNAERIGVVDDLQQSTAGMVRPGPASPRPASPISRSTKGYCKMCDNSIGDFYNSWCRVTGTYYVPALLGSYSVTLKSSGKQRPTTTGTALEGCIIQPLACPRSNCNNTLGFTVVTTPASKSNFRGRDFFKLSRIELRCEIVATNQYIVVEPREDAAPDLLAVEDTPSPSSFSTSKALTEAMEVNSHPSPFSQHLGYPHGPYGQPHDRHQQPQPPFHQIEVSRHMVAAPPLSVHSPIPSPVQSTMQKMPSSSLALPSPAAAASSTVDRMSHQESPRESAANTAGSLHGPPLIAPQNASQSNGHQYPRSFREISMDAIERLQTQISQNSGALSAHTRDIRRGEEDTQKMGATLRQEFQTQFTRYNADIQRIEVSQKRLHHDVQVMHHTMEAIKQELQAMRREKQPHATLPERSVREQDGAIELMAKQMSELSYKTSDVDHLKVHIEIMKGKIHRLEQAATHVPPHTPLQQYQPPQAPVAQSNPSAQMVVPPYRGPYNDKVLQPTPEVQQSRPSFPVPSSVPATTSSQTEPAATQTSSWATVNAGTKRAHENGVESPREAIADMPGSPKRQRLDSGTTQPPTPTLQSQTSVTESSLASQTQQSAYAPYTTQDAPSDQSWRPESQRMHEYRPRGRRRGGGPGSRGGRVRRSIPGRSHSSPEWERDDGQGVSDSRASPDSYYNNVSRGGMGSIARRGSGGGGGNTRGGYTGSDRATSLGLQGVSTGMHFAFGSSQDSLYGSGKKTRTKPIRNADGVLIRKDGRPDMRSQSSAANLRKVHQRKEGDASSHSPTSFTPTNLQHTLSTDTPDSPSPSGYAADPAASEKHNAIMGKMFPAGLDASRKQHDYTRQAFDDDADYTIHVRTPGHGVAPASRGSAPPQVKKEPAESLTTEPESDLTETEGQAEIEHYHTPEQRSSLHHGGSGAQDASIERTETDEDGDKSHTQSASYTIPETQLSDPTTK
ncbi:fe-s assembly co-chaperone [Pyrenophora seminiperda CCB06]|uniref:Fe-s assembly co-chaperone n=1 Tax=Pyrenophora seminiperda CCB06 TaxID=1302712 RepID=A0A3M7LXN5_9PLEO|nr:fe-s assembly co-chaperone [Pyrenophora seminiperda CCB06]